MNKEEIENIARSIKDELIKIRRDIHAHPEIGLNEFRTSKLVADKLRELGLEVETGIRITGVVGTLKGRYPGKTILMRADMDCLQLDELTNLEFKSEYPGYMHACGHDAHTTWLLGAAMILSHFKDRISGNIKFLFQPAEESVGGAEVMIKEGVLENPHVDAAVAAHVWPAIESGKVGIKYGAMMAAPDKFKIVIHGKGGHGAIPNKCIDPISIANHVYNELQTIISRKLDPLEPAIITVAKFNAGTAFNIIPDYAVMEGTVRTLSYAVRDEIPKLMETLVKGVTEANGGKYEFEYDKYYPPVINENSITSLLEEAASEFLGRDKLEKLDKATMIAEDFSFYQEKVPGVFFGIGTTNKSKGLDKGLHSPYFTIDEDILPQAAGLFSYFALKYLST